MDRLGELWRRLLFPFRRRQFDRDLEEEMRFHLEMKAQESGAADARRKFGNAALLQEDSRQAWGWTGVESWAADLKYAVRALRNNPGFAAVAVLTLALGIVASTAVFSVVHAVLLRPLPFRQPDRLMMIWETRETRGGPGRPASFGSRRQGGGQRGGEIRPHRPKNCRHPGQHRDPGRLSPRGRSRARRSGDLHPR